MKAETRAHLRRLWIQIIVTLIAAFAGILLLSQVNGSPNAPACAAPDFLCTRPELETWMQLDLPLSAQDVRFVTEAEPQQTIWLSFVASDLEVTQFLTRLAMQPAPDAETARAPERAVWWPGDEERVGLTVYASILDQALRRQYVALVQQSTGTGWQVYLFGRSLGTG